MFVKKLMPRSMRGFTLTEAAIVLGIVGLILGAIWVAAAAVYTNLRVSTTSNQLLQMVQSVRSLHATQNTVDPLLTGMAAGSLVIAKSGGIPKDMLDDPINPTVVRSVWGNNVEIASATTTVADDSFTITYRAIPPQACADLLTRNTGSGRDGGLSGAGAALPTIVAFPVSVTTAVATCGVAATSDLSFRFKLKS